MSLPQTYFLILASTFSPSVLSYNSEMAKLLNFLTDVRASVSSYFWGLQLSITATLLPSLVRYVFIHITLKSWE
jgi:hypothetical protein